MISIDTVNHTWCPTCNAMPGEPCKATKRATHAYLAALKLWHQQGRDSRLGLSKRGPEPRLNIRLHIDHDGATEAHLQRIARADALAGGEAQWRRDELAAVVLPLASNGALYRDGKSA